MKAGAVVAGVVVVGGGLFLLSRSGALAALETTIDTATGQPSPADQVRALAVRQPGPGNAPIAGVQSPSFVQAGGIAAVAGVGAAALPLLGIGGVALGLTTAGIGLAVAFISYELLRQRASMHVNDVRDQWQHQFIALSDALGIPQLTQRAAAGGVGFSPGDDGLSNGNVEMSRVIFYFDHDANNTLWKAVTKTQNESAFRAAAANVDAFLRAQGVIVQAPA